MNKFIFALSLILMTTNLLASDEANQTNINTILTQDILHEVAERTLTGATRVDVINFAGVCRSWRELAKDLSRRSPRVFGFLVLNLDNYNEPTGKKLAQRLSSETSLIELIIKPATGADDGFSLACANDILPALANMPHLCYLRIDSSFVVDEFVTVAADRSYSHRDNPLFKILMQLKELEIYGVVGTAYKDRYFLGDINT